MVHLPLWPLLLVPMLCVNHIVESQGWFWGYKWSEGLSPYLGLGFNLIRVWALECKVLQGLYQNQG